MSKNNDSGIIAVTDIPKDYVSPLPLLKKSVDTMSEEAVYLFAVITLQHFTKWNFFNENNSILEITSSASFDKIEDEGHSLKIEVNLSIVADYEKIQRPEASIMFSITQQKENSGIDVCVREHGLEHYMSSVSLADVVTKKSEIKDINQVALSRVFPSRTTYDYIFKEIKSLLLGRFIAYMLQGGK